ncbi:MAG: polysaccharide biosynthesis/export family protein [Deltaproteobacteria bacterium]|jgi:polysaccharide export outer membrane protein
MMTRTLSVLGLALLTFGCSSTLPFVWVHDLPRDDNPARIRPGDAISVVVKNQKQLTGEFKVGQQGTYVQPLVGTIRVAGLTPAEAAQQLAAQLDGIVVDPLVSVAITQPADLTIGILGEVKKPGTLQVPYGTNMLDIMARVGGLTQFADTEAIFVIRAKPRPVRIRFKYDFLIGGDPRSLSFPLRDGDVVHVE